MGERGVRSKHRVSRQRARPNINCIVDALPSTSLHCISLVSIYLTDTLLMHRTTKRQCNIDTAENENKNDKRTAEIVSRKLEN